MHHLPLVDLKTFSGEPLQWPEFIENFKACVHTKPTFNDMMQMERLISVLRGEVKKSLYHLKKQNQRMYHHMLDSNHGIVLQSKDNKLTCWLCYDKHKLHQCEMFKSKSLPEKKVIVEKERLCWNCLAKGHQNKECKSTVKCRITNCGKRHHTLLHEIKPPNPPKDDVTTNNLKANIDPKVYLQILPVKVSNGKRTVKTKDLLDAGVDSTLIREDIAKQLGLHGSRRNLEIHNAFLKSKTVESKSINFSVSSTDPSQKN